MSEATTDTEEVLEEQEEELTIESIASEQGWSPQDQWRGDPDDWKDAATFLREGARIQKEASRSAKARQKELDELSKRMDDLSNGQAKMLSHALSKAKAEWEKEKQEAWEEQDLTRFKRAEQEIEKLKEPEKEEPVKDTRAEAFQKAEKELYDEFPMFADDEDVKIEAYSASQALVAAKPDITPDEWREKIIKVVKRRLPEKFDKTHRRPAVGGGKTNSPSKGGKSFDDLPKEAQEAFEEILTYNPKYTKEKYAKAYFEQESQ